MQQVFRRRPHPLGFLKNRSTQFCRAEKRSRLSPEKILWLHRTKIEGRISKRTASSKAVLLTIGWNMSVLMDSFFGALRPGYWRNRSPSLTLASQMYKMESWFTPFWKTLCCSCPQRNATSSIANVQNNWNFLEHCTALRPGTRSHCVPASLRSTTPSRKFLCHSDRVWRFSQVQAVMKYTNTSQFLVFFLFYM